MGRVTEPYLSRDRCPQICYLFSMKTLIFLLLFAGVSRAIDLTPTERTAKIGTLLQKKHRQIAKCCGDSPTAKGKAEINVSWQIDDKGVPKNFTKSKVKPGNDKLFECVTKIIGEITFESAPKGEVFEIIEVPFTYTENK